MGALPSHPRLAAWWQRGCAFLGSDVAILGGAMTWVSERHLVAAISEAGAFGVIACGSMSPALLAAEIGATRARTARPFGVNLIVMHPQLDALIEVCVAHKVGHVVLAGGLPPRGIVDRIRAGGAKAVCFAPSVAVAKRLVRGGADALIIEGMEAGGHIGPVATSVLAQEILPQVSEVPIFVAGGIGSGEAIAAYLRMGASGVQIGTLFVCASESIAHPRFKQAFVRASARDAVPSVQIDPEFKVIPVRALANAGTKRFAVLQLEVIGKYRRGELTHEEASLAIEHYWAGALRRAVVEGDVENGSLMAGQSVGLVREERPASVIVGDLVSQAETALARERAGARGPVIAGRGGWGGDEPSAPKSGAAPSTGARRLLRRLIEVVAEPTTPQQRLDSITSMIAANLVAEVCSVYVLRAGEILELFATEGLAREAVHRTRMRVGEGLVGTIAAQAVVISTESAQQHPNFRYFPETREELYQTFLGVPILRGGKVVGVLVVQNRARRAYQEDEVEAMQIIATVLAEMFAGGGLVDLSQYADVASVQREPRRLEGMRLVEGVAIGRAWLHEPRVEITRILSDDPEAENARLERAFAELRAALDAMLAHPDLAAGEQREVIEAYRMFANDRGWMRRIREAVGSGLSAEAAVRRVQDETRARIGHAADPYMRERLLDLDDIADRLLRHLVGRPRAVEPKDLPDDLILVARTLSPADLMEYDRRRLRGIVLEEGSKTAHMTIVARAFDVPVVGRVDSAMAVIDQGSVVVLDGENGHIFVRPSEEVQSSFQQAIRARAERKLLLAALKDAPSVTADGVSVSLAINAAFLIDMADIAATGADGCGLFRTELAFMSRHQHPDLAAQTQLYAKALEQAEGRRVVFRTLDVGGDKRLPYWSAPAEENPAMGWRALRLVLDRPALLRWQLRALIAASGGRRLAVMFPMVAEVAELDAARSLLRLELDRAAAAGTTLPEAVEVGAMLEVPALLWQFDALLDRVDFLSVGSNDLLQFVYACDRGNPLLADRYDNLAPAALALFRDIVERCRAAGVRLCFCGEMASRPLEAMALLGIGARELSVSAADIGPVKAMLRSVDVGALGNYLRSLLHLPDRSLRGRLRSYALDHRVVLPEGVHRAM